MKKYIISDIHGDYVPYQTIMSYLEEKQKKEDLTLYINGDLFDRGRGSAELLLDIYQRMQENPFPIVYLAGNHEKMMMDTFEDRQKGIFSAHHLWYQNGGEVTDIGLQNKLKTKDKIMEVVHFVSNLKVYQTFPETIQDKRIILVHASCPLKVQKESPFLRELEYDQEYYLWAREFDPTLPFRCRIGHKDYFTIVGHTPNDSPNGFEYHQNYNYLNMDGGCSYYQYGLLEYDHVPLVEIRESYLRLLTWNHQGEIIAGNYFDGKRTLPFTEDELRKEQEFASKIKRKED